MSADHVIETISRAGGRAIAVEANLSDIESAPRLFDAAEAAFGGVDILIDTWR